MWWLIFSEWSLSLHDPQLRHPEKGGNGSFIHIASGMFHQSGSYVFWEVLPGNCWWKRVKAQVQGDLRVHGYCTRVLHVRGLGGTTVGRINVVSGRTFLKNNSCLRTDWAALGIRSYWPWTIHGENGLILCWKWLRRNLVWIELIIFILPLLLSTVKPHH